MLRNRNFGLGCGFFLQPTMMITRSPKDFRCPLICNEICGLESQQGRGTRHVDHTLSLKWLDDISALSRDKLTWAKQSVSRPWSLTNSCATELLLLLLLLLLVLLNWNTILFFAGSESCFELFLWQLMPIRFTGEIFSCEFYSKFGIFLELLTVLMWPGSQTATVPWNNCNWTVNQFRGINQRNGILDTDIGKFTGERSSLCCYH